MSYLDKKYKNTFMFSFYKNKMLYPYLYVNDGFNRDVDLSQHPYIATRGFQHTYDINDNVEFNFYITDWNNENYTNNTFNSKFKISLNINNIDNTYSNIFTYNNELAGDKNKNIGKLPTGEYQVVMQIEDEYGRKSHELYNEFRVINKSEHNANIDNHTYIMTVNDLTTYNLDNTDNAAKAEDNRVGLQNLFNTVHDNGYLKIIMLPGTYRIKCNNKKVYTGETTYIEYTQDVLSIPSNFNIDLNGCTCKQMTSNGQSSAWLIAMNNISDSHIYNGILQGDWGIRNMEESSDDPYCDGEHLGCGGIFGDSKYCSFHDITVKDFLGHAVSIGTNVIGCETGKGGTGSFSILFEDKGKLSNWTNVELDDNGEETPSDYKWTCGYVDLSAIPGLLNKPVLRVSPYLGNQWYGCEGDDWIIPYYFYDENKNLIKKIIGHQYRDIKIPSNANYLRATYSMERTNNDLTSINEIMVMYPGFPRNNDFYNIAFEHIRPCALAPYQGNAIHIDNCTIANCGNNITPIAIDFEDGWNNMQDYHVSNCEVITPAGTADLVTKGGIDILCENLTNFRCGSNSTTRGLVYRNCPNVPYIRVHLYEHRRSGYVMCYNNNCTVPSITSNDIKYLQSGWGSIVNIEESSDYPFVVKNCSIKQGGIGYGLPNNKYENCVIDFNYLGFEKRTHGITGNHENCEFINMSPANGYNGVNNFKLVNGKFINCEVEAIQGTLELVNCEVQNVKFTNYSQDVNIKLTNCNIKNFRLNRLAWADKKNINIELVNCIIENDSSYGNILSDDWNNKDFSGSQTFTVLDKGNTYLNNTVLASNTLKNNSNIIITQE